MTEIRAALVGEYLKLSRRDAEIRLAMEEGKRELPVLRARAAGLMQAIKAYDLEATAEADSYLVDHFVLGWPTDGITEVLSDISGREWTDDDVCRRAAELGIQRPRGWNEVKANADLDAADSNEDEWLEAAYGLPGFTDDPPPAPRLALPAPALTWRVPPPVEAPDLEMAQTPAPEIDPRIGPWLAHRWTPARIAIIERDWPTYRLTDDIVAELNSLPGQTIYKDQVSMLASSKLNIRRPDDYRQRLMWERGASVVGWCTPERRVILDNDYPNGVSMRLIREKLEAAEGAKLPSAATIETYCKTVLGLERKRKGTAGIPVAEQDHGFTNGHVSDLAPEPLDTEPAQIAGSEPDQDVTEQVSSEIAPLPGGDQTDIGIPISEQDQGVAAEAAKGIGSADTLGDHPEPKPDTALSLALAAARPTLARVETPRPSPALRPAAPQPKDRLEALLRVSRSIGPLPTTRDGSISFAAMQAKTDAQPEVATVSWKDAMDWATRNKVPLGGTEEEDLAATNAARATWGLPAFAVPDVD